MTDQPTSPPEQGVSEDGGQPALFTRLLDMYFCFGDYDGIATAEFPSNVDAAAASLAISSSGAFSNVKTTVLITMDESVQAMEKAEKVSAAYSAPAS